MIARLRDRLGAVPDRAIGAGVVVAFALASVLVFGGAIDRAFQRKGDEVSAVFRTTSQLSPGSPVRVNGVEQGRVSSIELRADRRSALVRMEVFDESLPLYRDARASIKTRNVLGGTYYIDLDRGVASAGELPGQHIALAATSTPVEVDQVLADSLAGAERKGLGTLLAEVPRAVEDERALEGALGAVDDAAPTLRRGVAAARGRRDGDLRVLVRNTAAVTRSLARDDAALTRLVEGGGVVTEAVARRRREVQDSIGRSAAVLPEVETTLQRLDATLRAADPLLTMLRRPATQVAPTLAALRPTLVDAERLLLRARPLVRSLRPAATALAATARDGGPLIDELTPSVKRLGETILPDLNKVDGVTGRTTAQMVGPTIGGLGAAAGTFDQLSHMVGLAAGGDPTRALDTSPCRAWFFDPDADTADEVLECKQIAKYLNDLFTYKPLPRP